MIAEGQTHRPATIAQIAPLEAHHLGAQYHQHQKGGGEGATVHNREH